MNWCQREPSTDGLGDESVHVGRHAIFVEPQTETIRDTPYVHDKYLVRHVHVWDLHTIKVFFVEGLRERSKACYGASFFVCGLEHDLSNIVWEGTFWIAKQGIYLMQVVSGQHASRFHVIIPVDLSGTSSGTRRKM